MEEIIKMIERNKSKWLQCCEKYPPPALNSELGGRLQLQYLTMKDKKHYVIMVKKIASPFLSLFSKWRGRGDDCKLVFFVMVDDPSGECGRKKNVESI